MHRRTILIGSATAAAGLALTTELAVAGAVADQGPELQAGFFSPDHA